MKSRKHILALAFAASIAMTGAATIADAGPMHAGAMHGAHAPGAHLHSPAHWHGHNRGWGFSAYPLFYGGYHGGGCGWLHRKAVTTGSPYWWSRYDVCIGG